MADLNFRRPGDDELEPLVDPMNDPVFDEPPLSDAPPPDDDELPDEQIEELKQTLSDKVLQKLGLAKIEVVDKYKKAANDNRREFRTLSEKVARIEQQREVRQPAPTGPTSEELWAKFDESGDPKDRAAALRAHEAEIERKMDERLRAQESQINQTFNATQYQRELDAALAKPENADINMEEVEDYFNDPKNRYSPPEETIFMYRARHHKGGVMGYIDDLARSRARQPQGANTAPAGGGTRRQQFPANAGRRLTKEEALADYRGQKG